MCECCHFDFFFLIHLIVKHIHVYVYIVNIFLFFIWHFFLHVVVLFFQGQIYGKIAFIRQLIFTRHPRVTYLKPVLLQLFNLAMPPLNMHIPMIQKFSVLLLLLLNSILLDCVCILSLLLLMCCWEVVFSTSATTMICLLLDTSPMGDWLVSGSNHQL